MPFPNPSTQFQQGNPGGPGRPKKGVITDLAAEMLAQPHPKFPDKTRAQVIAERWLDRSEEDDKPLDLLLNRTEGKVADKLEVEDKRESNVVELPEKELHADQATTGTSDEVPGK